MVRSGIKFIGVVKTASRNFPMNHVYLVNRFDTYILVRRKTPDYNACDILGCVWMDRDKNYFIEYGY